MTASREFPETRRKMLAEVGAGFGTLALAGMFQREGLLAADGDGQNLLPRSGHRPARARAVIQLFQNGGPSQMDLFDDKPELTRQHGKVPSQEIETFQLDNNNVLLKSPFSFQHHGKCGMHLGETIPHISAIADDICLVRSMHTGHNNHPFAINMMQTGKTFAGRPAMGSWICYGLGTERDDLPGYIVLRDPQGYNTSGKMVWSSGWLPAVFQGTEFNSGGDAVHHLNPGKNVTASGRRRALELLATLNRRHQQRYTRETELEARIQNYELAARMQLAAADLLDVKQETRETRSRYGLDNPTTAAYGLRCLMARRLVEAGVRFVQIFPPVKPSSQPWDNHNNLPADLPNICRQTDQPSAALVTDLKQRGLLDEVIVMWTGEFGRLPISEAKDGRDHNRNAFSLWMAGGGFRAGHVHGGTDDFGYAAVEDRVSVADLHATILQQLGLDHRRLAYRVAGRPERLTDPDVTGARVVDGLLA
ncbi:MAG: DUF1501 domain-containing protein [Planctomycetaceae bacterium]|nr:DUF1501 domain-containing protein [Planctomycetaceae bacterium]